MKWQAYRKIATATPSPADDFWLPPCEPAPADNTPKVNLWCQAGDCFCSELLPGPDHAAGCSSCGYAKAPAAKRTPTATETEPATFEQTGDPVTCPYWYQTCHAVGFYQDACTRCTDCQIFKFLEDNT